MKNNLIIGLSLLVLGLSGYLLYDSFNGGMSKAEVQSEFTNLKTDYEVLQTDLEAKVHDLNLSNTIILAQKEKMDKLLRKSSITEEELLEAKKLMREISQSVLNEYKKRVVNLEKEKSGLLTDNEKDAAEMKMLNDKIKLLEQDKSKISTKYIYEKVASEKKDDLLVDAAKLTLSNFVLKSFKVRSSGKEIETDKASRISRIKVSFDINENKIADSGRKEMYIVVKKPDGNLATFTGKTTGNFISEGKNLTYSDKISVDYTKGQEKNVEFVWDNEEFQRGDYVLEVYENSGKKAVRIGKATKTLE